ncbi:MAG: methyltransferase [Proteobacteria bacterium]|nr:methyltransferase [Pseudomonadota bacterium]MBS0571761.1 methyltransferase [Pseudomonadota bacterium]
MTAPDLPLTRDGFLGGRLAIFQPVTGYRAATDPVLLAAAVAARPGDSTLELGCGVGVASLCLMSRVAGLQACGIELQPLYAGLARRNADANHLPLEVVEGDLRDRALSQRRFDHVLANPPYFRAGDGTAARDGGRETAFREMAALADWIDVALRRARDGGSLTFIHLAERLPDLLSALSGRAGAIEALPIAPRAGRPASRIIVRARKGSRAPFRLLSPFILHEGPAHLRDSDDFTGAARAVLREGTALPGLG